MFISQNRLGGIVETATAVIAFIVLAKWVITFVTVIFSPV